MTTRRSRWHPSVLARRGGAIVMLAAIFMWDLVLASVTVARAVLTPRPRLRPAILAVPAKMRTPTGVAIYASFLSLTPGSVAVGVSADRRTIFVHVLDVENSAARVAAFERDFGRWIERAEP